MRVNDEVWHNALSCERKIFLPVEHPNCTFLTMSTSELVTNLRDTLRSHLDLNETLPKFIDCNCDLIDFTSLRMLKAS